MALVNRSRAEHNHWLCWINRNIERFLGTDELIRNLAELMVLIKKKNWFDSHRIDGNSNVIEYQASYHDHFPDSGAISVGMGGSFHIVRWFSDVSIQGTARLFFIHCWRHLPVRYNYCMWWHHDRETLSTSSVHCLDNPPATGGFSTQCSGAWDVTKI